MRSVRRNSGVFLVVCRQRRKLAKYSLRALHLRASARTFLEISEKCRLNLAVLEVFPDSGKNGRGEFVLVLGAAQFLFLGGI